jgi:DNA invertase Pin-like site-specific DNA recombinase
VASSVDLVFCDLPSGPPGPMGRFLLTQMAAVAELEAGLIGERTKNALAAAKARGVKHQTLRDHERARHRSRAAHERHSSPVWRQVAPDSGSAVVGPLGGKSGAAH